MKVKSCDLNSEENKKENFLRKIEEILFTKKKHETEKERKIYFQFASMSAPQPRRDYDVCFSLFDFSVIEIISSIFGRLMSFALAREMENRGETR